MSRAGFRNFWLVVVAVLLIGAFFVMRESQKYQAQIEQAESRRERLVRDLQAGAQLSAALARLDNLTIDEGAATRLDILRHLNLEKTNLKFQVSAKSEQKIGKSKLFIRKFTLSGELPYPRTLEQMDWLHSTKKVAMDKITLEPGKKFRDGTQFKLQGTLYGLDKKRKKKKKK